MNNFNNNLLPDDNGRNRKVYNNENDRTFRSDGFSKDYQDNNISNFGCKYGTNCCLFKPANYQEGLYLKNMMEKCTTEKLFAWDGCSAVYRKFISEHPKFAKYESMGELPVNIKMHFKLFLINRVSSGSGSMFNSAYDYFIKNTYTRNGDSDKIDMNVNMKRKNSEEVRNNIQPSPFMNFMVEPTIYREFDSNREHKGSSKTKKETKINPNRHKNFISSNKCQGLGDAIEKGLQYHCKASGKKYEVNPTAPPFYCEKCHCWHVGKKHDETQKDIAKCKKNVSNSNNKNNNSSNNKKPSTGNSSNGGGSGDTSSSLNAPPTIGGATNQSITPGKVEEQLADGGKKVTETKEDGSSVVITYDKDGNEISRQELGPGAAGGGAAGGYSRTTGLYAPSSQDGDDGTGNHDKALVVNEQDYDLDELNEAISSTGTDVFGDSMDDLQEINFLPGYPESDHSHRTRILGLPLQYSPICDPNGRVFAETTMMDLPLIYIAPGRGIINKQVDDQVAEDLKAIAEDYTSTDVLAGVRNAASMQDLRALSFESAFKEYIEYFENLATIVYGNMGLKGIFKWSKALDMNWGDIVDAMSLVFFADVSSSVSDSFSNEYTDSPLVAKANDFALLVRQYRHLFKNSDANEIGQQVSGSDVDAATSGGGISDLVSKLSSGIGRILNGSQLQYPQVWNDSRHDRSYSLSFKFYSPYGDKESIFKYVYLPTLALLALSLPRMDSISGYGQPFYLKVNSPGWFECSMGVIQSMTIEKGGDDKMWTVDGLPQELNVTLTMQDMYSTMSMTKNSSLMAFNLGLQSYLDCMAGLRTDKLIQLVKVEGWFKGKISKIHSKLTTGIPMLVGDGVKSFIENILR